MNFKGRCAVIAFFMPVLVEPNVNTRLMQNAKNRKTSLPLGGE